MTQVIFCHGLESGPNGRKSSALTEFGMDVVAPDFRGQDLAHRVRHLNKVLSSLTAPAVVVGSSYGGITAALSAMEHPEKVKALVLCAPALERDEAPANTTELVPVVRTTIIHGRFDTVVPLAVSKRYADKHKGVQLLPVLDGHRLGDKESLQILVELVEDLVENDV